MVRRIKKTTDLKIAVPLKNLDWGGLGRIKYIPVKYARIRDKTQRTLADPLPEHDVLRHRKRLQLPFGIQVEDLQSALGLERDDILGPVHDGAVGLDGSPRDIVAVVQIDNHDLSGSFVALFPHTDVAIAF